MGDKQTKDNNNNKNNNIDNKNDKNKKIQNVDDLDVDNLDITETLSIEVVDKIKFKFRSANQIELVNANIRNILFCGASRSGKTTSFNVFKDPCYCPEKTTMFSETQSTNFKSYSLKNNKTNEVHSFILNMIDSPGTFEIRSAKDDFKTRSNEEIGKLIVECLNHEVTYLNLIAMFLTIGGRVSDKDIESIELFLNMFGGIGMPIILCITHADEFNEVKMKSIESEIKDHPSLKKYFDENKFKILFMGCVDHKHNDYYDVNVIAKKYSQVLNWRNNFIELIFKSEERYDLKKTNIFTNRKENIILMVDTCINEINHLINLDPETGEYKRRIVIHNVNMEYLYRNKLILDEDGSIDSKNKTEHFWELIQNVKKNQKLSENQKIELIKPWQL